MSRADKPATKPPEHALTATEAYQLAPMQSDLHAAMDNYNRALRQIHGLAIGVLDRGGEKDADPTNWHFDVRDNGVYLVKGGDA